MLTSEEKDVLRKTLEYDGVYKRLYLSEEENARYANASSMHIPVDIGYVTKKDPKTGEEKKIFYQYVIDEEVWRAKMYVNLSKTHSKVTFLWLLAIINLILSGIAFFLMLILRH